MNVEEPIMPTQISTGSSSSMTVDAHQHNSHQHQQQDHFLSMALWGGKEMDDDELSLLDDIHNQFSAINLIDDNIAEVQRLEKESKMRKEMTKLLEMCLRAQDNKCDMTPSQSNESISKLATLLEARLYKSAHSFESYCDLQTLESRMRVVLFHLKNQRQQKRRKRQTAIGHQRSDLLKQKMGLTQYARAEHLVKQIQQRKNLLAGQSCTKCQINGTCAPSMVIQFGEHLPAPVRDLFFRTPFVEVFSKYPLERIHTLHWQQLQEMMEQAERHLQEYDSWKMIHG